MGCSASSPSKERNRTTATNGDAGGTPADSMPVLSISSNAPHQALTTKRSGVECSVSSCGESTNTNDGATTSDSQPLRGPRKKKKQFRSLLDDPKQLLCPEDAGSPLKIDVDGCRTFSTGSNYTQTTATPLSPAKVSVDFASKSTSDFNGSSTTRGDFFYVQGRTNSLADSENTFLDHQQSTVPYIETPPAPAIPQPVDQRIVNVPSLNISGMGQMVSSSSSSSSCCSERDSPLLPHDSIITPQIVVPNNGDGFENNEHPMADPVEFPLGNLPISRQLSVSHSGGSYDGDFGELLQSCENTYNTTCTTGGGASLDDASMSLSVKKGDPQLSASPDRSQNGRRVSFHLMAEDKQQLHRTHSANIATPRQPRSPLQPQHPCAPADSQNDLTRGI